MTSIILTDICNVWTRVKLKSCVWIYTQLNYI